MNDITFDCRPGTYCSVSEATQALLPIATPLDSRSVRLDVVRRRLALPDGRVKWLSKLPCRLIDYLVQVGGAASKEQLATDVWGVRSYHPLRDDKRMHVAVHRLRRLIERNPAHPELLITTADGYALSSIARVSVRSAA